jgi:RNA polymerase sigma-70 factor, ECF subfamily
LTTDEQLLAAISRGDNGAFEQLYERHHRVIRSRISTRLWLLGFVSATTDPDDLLQETFEGVRRSAARFGGRGEVGAWIWGIAKHKIADRLRRPRRSVVMPAEELQEIAELESMVDVVERQYALEKIEQLPQNHRDALLLRVTGFSFKEIASILQTNPNTAKTWVRRAREALGSLLA